MGDLTYLIEIISFDDETVEIRSVAPSTEVPRRMRIGTAKLIDDLSPLRSPELVGKLLSMLGDSKEGGSYKDDPSEDSPEVNTPLKLYIDIGLQDGLPLQLHQLIEKMAAPNVRVHRMWPPFPVAASIVRESFALHEIDIAAEEEGGSNEGGRDRDDSNDDSKYEVGSGQD